MWVWQSYMWCALAWAGAHGFCHGHAIFRVLSFTYVLYKGNVYDFDRHHATPMCVLGFVSQPHAYATMHLL